MWFSVSEHLLVTFYSLIMGVFFGVLYDCLRLSRAVIGIGNYSAISHKLRRLKMPFSKANTPSHNSKGKRIVSNLWVFAGDIFYSLVCAAIYSLFMFHAIRGQVRWYFILASAIGFFIYYFTLSKFILSLLEILLFGIKTVLRCIFGIILLPFKHVFRIIKKLILTLILSVVKPLVTDIRYRSAARFTESSRKGLCDSIRF